MLEALHDNALKVLSEAGYHNVENIKTAFRPRRTYRKIKDAHLSVSVHAPI